MHQAPPSFAGDFDLGAVNSLLRHCRHYRIAPGTQYPCILPFLKDHEFAPTSITKMSTPVTEIGFIPVRTETEIDDASSNDGKKWRSIVDSCLDVPGYIQGYVGRQTEDTTSVMQLIGMATSCYRRKYRLTSTADWESIELHEDFIKHPSYNPMMANLTTLQNGECIFYHAYLLSANLKPTTLNQLFQSTVPAVTEVRTLYFSSLLSASERFAFEKSFSIFCHTLLDELQGLTCVAGGWVVEELECDKVSGGKAKAFCIVEGWESWNNQQASLKKEAYNLFPDAMPLVKHSELRGGKLVAQTK